MGTTRKQPRRRARRLSAFVIAILALALSSGIIVYGAAEPASATAVTIDNPLEIVPITDPVWPFDGHANPFETITVQLPGGGGTGCTDVADAAGAWACNVTFTETNEFTLVQAISFNHATPDQNEDTQEYAVTIPPVVTETPQTPGALVSNVTAQPEFTGIADPGATVDGTIGGQLCTDVADGAGAYTCQIAGGLGADADYPITVRQTPAWGTAPGNTSVDALSIYRLDTAAPGIPDFSYPYDTIGPGANEFTSNTTPPLGGNPGTTEPFATVTVWGYQFSPIGVAPGWPPIPPDPGATYCTTMAAADGSWSCTGTALPVNAVWVFGSTAEDLAGNGTGSPDAEFSVQIGPPPPAPTVLQPVIGYTSQARRVHIATTNIAEGTMYVREAGVDLCPPTPVGVSTFSCDTAPLSIGLHHINIFQQDQFDTFSASVQRTVLILAPPVRKTFAFTFTVMGKDGPVGPEGITAGEELTIVADGLPVGTVISAEIHSTPIALGSTSIGPGGALRMPVTVPEVDAGDHEIVVFASADDYDSATVASPVTVRAVKQIPEETDEEVKELGEPSDAEPSGSGGTGGNPGNVGGGGFDDPTEFGTSVVPPLGDHSFLLTPAGVALSGSIAIAFLLLVGFPAELLESTIRSNYDRAFGWLARFRRRVGKMLAPVARVLSNPWVGSGLTILAAAILLGFADPGFGFNGASVRLVLAMILAVLAINVGLTVIVMRVARRAFDASALLVPMPAALGIVALSVLVSRLAGISPGFLFGVVLGVAYARELRLRDEARLGVLGVGLTIAAGLLAWCGYGLATAVASGPGFVNNLVIETMAAITLEALGTLLVALLPIEFLDGRTIFRWSKLAWAGLYALTVLIFVFVVLPLSDNWGSMSAPIFGWGTLFAVFAAVAIITWAVFHRRARATASSPEAAAPPQRQRR